MTIGIEPGPEVPILGPEAAPIVEIPATPTIEAEELADDYGKFVAEPLERGFGTTLGNALRRVLLNSLLGSAVHAVRIDGVQHEYSTLAGIREDVTEIILNIKGVRLRGHSDRPGTLRLDVQGPGQVTAGDIQPSADYDIVNPEAYIASLSSADARLSMDLHVEQGKGYKAATPVEDAPIGVLPVDAIYTPSRRVNYHVEKTRVGQITDYEKLTIEIWTDGSKSPLEAMRESAQLLVESFGMFAGIGLDAEQGRKGLLLGVSREHYNMPVEKLDLSVRTLNCLKRGKIDMVGEILDKSREELLQIKNFGEKSLDELSERLAALGIISADEAAAGVTALDDAADAAVDVLALPRSFGPDDEPPAREPAPEDDEAESEKPRRLGAEPVKDLSALRALLGEENKGTANETETE